MVRLASLGLAAAIYMSGPPASAQERPDHTPDQTNVKQCAALTGDNYERCVKQFRSGAEAPAPKADSPSSNSGGSSSGDGASQGQRPGRDSDPAGLGNGGVNAAPDPHGGPPPRSPTSRTIP